MMAMPSAPFAEAAALSEAARAIRSLISGRWAVGNIADGDAQYIIDRVSELHGRSSSPAPASFVPSSQSVEASPDSRSAVARALFDEVNNCVDDGQLNRIYRLVCQQNADGKISDGDGQWLLECIAGRRPLGGSSTRGHLKPASGATGRLAARLGSIFKPRRRQRSPDPAASRDRRRRLGGSSALPDNLRHHYTEGQRSVLCIYAMEVKRHGICDLPIDKIAAMAGVCRTTVQTTQHKARSLGHIKVTERPQRGRKSLPNLVEIVSPEWRAWIRHGPSSARGIGSKFANFGVNLASPTESVERKKAAFGKEVWRAGTRNLSKHPAWRT
jgi:hypothetical protein